MENNMRDAGKHAAEEGNGGSGARVNRLDFLRMSALAGGALALAPGAFAADAPKPAAGDKPNLGEKPNLVVIVTDEHNFRTLGCYRALLPKEQAFVWGEGIAVETPHIDSIAKNGLLCDRFYAASPVCTPSRAAFFSGRYPQNTDAYVNDRPMNDNVVTFAETLRRNGYMTGYAGKWHLDGPAKPGWGPARKFGFEDNKYMFNRGHYKQLEDTPTSPRVKGGNNYNIKGADEKSFTTDFLADKTAEFIKEHKDKPFCFVTSIPDPHGPNTVRPPYDTMFADLKFQQPRSALEPGAGLPLCAVPPAKPHLENMSHYFGMVKCIDDNVGKILAALRAAGVAERTIVVFTSDHGDMCGEHGRVNKGIPLEGSARIPFLMSYPGRIKPGTVIHEALNNTDFKPTILALMGAPRDGDDQRGDEGRDASALFLTGKAPASWKNVTISRNANGLWLMAATSRYKFIVSPDSDPCLLDLDQDPFEMKNIFAAPASRPIVRDLAQALVDYAKQRKEIYADDPAIRADLTWAAGDSNKYVPPKRIKKGPVVEEDEK
ncbi:MAG: sulfatase [Candidatus Sumerlaeota bacterium]|nr:sulfatase [Candidatus Sumerlaeota bacterium]